MVDNNRFDPHPRSLHIYIFFSSFVLLDKYSLHIFNTHLSRERVKEKRLDSTSSIIILKWKNARRVYSSIYVRVLLKDEYTITIRGDLCMILSRFVQASIHYDCIVSALWNRMKTVTLLLLLFILLSLHWTVAFL